MPAMLSKLYHALLGAGVDDATATAAAEEAAQGDTRLATIEMKVTQLQGDMETRFARIEGLMETRFARVDGDIGRTLDAVKALSKRTPWLKPGALPSPKQAGGINKDGLHRGRVCPNFGVPSRSAHPAACVFKLGIKVWRHKPTPGTVAP